MDGETIPLLPLWVCTVCCLWSRMQPDTVLWAFLLFIGMCVPNRCEGVEAYAERVAGGYRPANDPKLPPELSALIEESWSQDPRHRLVESVIT